MTENVNINEETSEAQAQFFNISQGFNDEQLFSHKEIISKSYVKVNKSEQIRKAINDSYAGNNLNSSSKADNSFNEIIDPEYCPEKLKEFYDTSGTLRACINAYSINISGRGFEFIPELKAADNPELENQIAEAEIFFDNISLDTPWIELQQELRIDLEIYGNAYLEWERDGDNGLQGCILIEPDEVRLTKYESKPIMVDHIVKSPSTLEYIKIKRFRKFRKFVQYSGTGTWGMSAGTKLVWFKEFGDPRIMNACTGQYFTDTQGNYANAQGEYYTINSVEFKTYLARLEAEGQEFKQATDILHFKIKDPGNKHGYGVPRWVTEIPVMLGVRSSDLINMNLLKNKGIPDLILIVEGANAEAIKAMIEDQISQNKKLGQFGNMLVISGPATRNGPAGPTADFNNPSIRIEALSQLLTKEGMFMTYYDKASERIAGVFRLPNLFIGKLNEINRATAEVALEQANVQVFQPERINHDARINKFIMTDLRLSFLKYRSKAYSMDNPELKNKIVEGMARNAAITPAEHRKIAGSIINETLPVLDEEWMNTPLAVAKKQSVENKVSATADIQPVKKGLVQLEFTPDSEAINTIKALVEKHHGLKNAEAYIYINEAA